MNKYHAIVAGAGPAGIATVATLLDFATKPFKLLWVDPEFNAGRLSSYLEVPRYGILRGCGLGDGRYGGR